MHVLHEVHEPACRCSYCHPFVYGKRQMHYGLNVPPGWRKFNAWWVIKYARGRYLRWTWPRAFFGPQVSQPIREDQK